MSTMTNPLIRVKNLRKDFVSAGKTIRAVDDVSLSVEKGEKLGLVGESGCGKSTLGKSMLRLIEPDAGEIYFEDQNILKLRKSQLRHLRKDMQIIFQDPYSSLNPRMKLRQIVGRPLEVHRMNENEREKRIAEVLELVNLSPGDMNKYPHEFSGGQRQRIALARALVTNPKFIVLDEPTSALDVSVQSVILNLLNDLLKRFGTTYIFVSHDLAVVSRLCDEVCVMYLGKIVESAPTAELFRSPLHPYTRMLLSALLIPGLNVQKVPVTGEPPSMFNVPSGCRFYPRCERHTDLCREKEPTMVKVNERHSVMCHLDN